MTSSISIRRYGAALAATMLVLVLGLAAAPVSAHHRDGHANTARGGDGGRSAATNQDAVTEDNDDNDGNTPNNVPDEGDNAHPSGRDRSVEPGGSGNQGASTSDPDGDSNGGADKPGGAGGTDLADQDGNNGCGNDDDFEDDNNGNCGGRERARQRTLPSTTTTTTTVGGGGGGAGGAGGGGAGGAGGGGAGGAGGGGGQVGETGETGESGATGQIGETGGATVAGIAVDRAAGGDVTTPKIETSVLGVSFDRDRGAPASVETPAASGASVLGAAFTRGGVLARTGSEILLIALTGIVMAVFGFGLTRFGRRSTT